MSNEGQVLQAHIIVMQDAILSARPHLQDRGVIARCAGTRRFGAPRNKPPQARAKHALR